MTTIISTIRKPDGALVRVETDGRARPVVQKPLRPMTQAEVELAAQDDPDARPLSEAERSDATPVARAKTIRRALGLTQEAFAARYDIPVGTLRDWEQGRAAPDQTARAYLKAIAGDPAGIRRALAIVP